MAKRFTVEPIWEGQTVVVIGGGPSLSFDQLRTVARARQREQCRVVAVNDQVYFAWWADWLHAADELWWQWHRDAAPKFPGIKTTVCETVPDGWVTGWLRATGKQGFDPDPSCLRHGSTSVYQAMHIAVHAGAKRILLIGVDMKRMPGRTHCHSGHPVPTTVDYEATMLPNFPTMIPALDERGVSVVNCTPGSALKCFPMGNVDLVFRNHGYGPEA